MAGPICWFAEQLSTSEIYLHGVSTILATMRTSYQEVAIVECPTLGKALFLDGKLQSAATDEFIYHEAIVHPPCISLGGPRSVLVLGGGEGATVREVLRWRTVEEVVMVDIDREVVNLARRLLPEMSRGAFEDRRLQLVYVDALEFLRESTRKWDLVISDLSEPLQSGPSWRLFTRESFELIATHLRPNGAFTLQAGPVGPQYLGSYARLVATMRSVFPFVRPYSIGVPSFPAPWGFIIGSTGNTFLSQDAAAIDRSLNTLVEGVLLTIDGQWWQAIGTIPRYLRDAFHRETRLVTLADPLPYH